MKNEKEKPRYRATTEEKRQVIDRLAKRIKDHATLQGSKSLSESYETCRKTAASWVEDFERRKAVRNRD